MSFYFGQELLTVHIQANTVGTATIIAGKNIFSYPFFIVPIIYRIITANTDEITPYKIAYGYFSNLLATCLPALDANSDVFFYNDYLGFY